MKAVTDENTPISQAAKDHGVPVSTLHDRISGKISHGDKPGPKPLLSAVKNLPHFGSLDMERQERKHGV